MIPDFQSIMRPLLELTAGGNTMTVAEIRLALAKHFRLSADEIDCRHPSGDRVFYNRVRWAITHLRHAEVIASPQKGLVVITDRGKSLLSAKTGALGMKDLAQFDEYKQFTGNSKSEQVGDVIIPVDEPSDSPGQSSAHIEIQYLLLKLGSDMGMDIWVARNDRGRSFKDQQFLNIPRMKADLPLQFDEVTMRTIELIDVLWLQGNAIVAAFEIESTTSIYSGLLRMADLVSMQPNINIPLYIVAPDARRDKVISETNRPTFQRLKPSLSHVCRYISFSLLRSKMEEVASVTKYLKPDFLRDISESCRIE